MKSISSPNQTINKITSPYPDTISEKNSGWHVLLATWLGEMFDGMDASIFILALFPSLSELLNTTSHSTVGVYGSIILATFMIGWAIGGIAFGILADYIGRTRTMVITILLYAICTGLCATSHNWGELAFYRFLVGCGIGGAIGIGGIMISECWQGKSRLHAVGVMTSSFGFGYLAAALLNLCLGHSSWRWLFLVGVIPALLTVYIRTKLKEPAHFQLLQEYKKRLQAKSNLNPEEQEFLGFTLPKIFNRQNCHKTLVVSALASTAIIGYWAVLSWIPPWVNQLTGTTAVQERSLTAIIMNIGTILAAITTSFVIGWLGYRNTIRIAFTGALICCVGMFLTVKVFGLSLLAWVFWVGFFAVMPFVLLFIYIPPLFNTAIRATAFGFSLQIGRILAACAALTSGQLIAMFSGSYATAGACVASCYLAGILASFFMPTAIEQITSGLPDSDNKPSNLFALK